MAVKITLKMSFLFVLKHRLKVSVRNDNIQCMFGAKTRQIKYTPVNPSFTLKWVQRGINYAMCKHT